MVWIVIMIIGHIHCVPLSQTFLAKMTGAYKRLVSTVSHCYRWSNPTPIW